MSAPSPSAPAGPSHNDLYLLVAGIILGVLLGPAVLGRVRPEIHQRYFLTVRQAQELLDKQDAKIQAIQSRLLTNLSSTGVTDVAGQELSTQFDSQLQPFRQQLANARRTQGTMLALVVAIAILMVIEAAVAPDSLAARSRLATAHYGLTAMWLALVLAQPDLFLDLSIPFLGVLLILALAVALVPLTSNKTRAPQP